MSDKLTRKKRKARIGRPPKHGGYSLMVQRGELPENRKHIKKYLTEVRDGLISDLGPAEDNLTAAQIVLIDRVISKLGVVRCIEEFCKDDGVMQGKRLAPSLRESYLAYNNSIRLDLQALGINTRKTEEVGLAEYIAENYPDKKDKKDD